MPQIDEEKHETERLDPYWLDMTGSQEPEGIETLNTFLETKIEEKVSFQDQIPELRAVVEQYKRRVLRNVIGGVIENYERYKALKAAEKEPVNKRLGLWDFYSASTG